MMSNEEFEKILERRLAKIRSTLATKAKEYATADRLHNFKRSAAILGGTPHQACVGFMTKHLVSILDLTDSVARGVIPAQEAVDEKVGDAINYLILLEALFNESRQL